jgi:hypothetical protein
MKHIIATIVTLFAAPAVLAHQDHTTGPVQHALHHLGQAEYWLLAGATCLAAVGWYAWRRHSKKQPHQSASQDTTKLEQ